MILFKNIGSRQPMSRGARVEVVLVIKEIRSARKSTHGVHLFNAKYTVKKMMEDKKV